MTLFDRQTENSCQYKDGYYTLTLRKNSTAVEFLVINHTSPLYKRNVNDINTVIVLYKIRALFVNSIMILMKNVLTWQEVVYIVLKFLVIVWNIRLEFHNI